MNGKMVFAYITLAIGLFSACTKRENGAQKTDLRIIIPWVNEELNGFLPVIQEFEAQNPNIKVQYQTAKPEDISTILAVQFQAQKTPADVIDTSFAWYIRQQAKRGHVLDLSDVLNKENFVKGSFSEVSIGKAIYGVPGTGGITVPEYRKSQFAKDGIQAPEEKNDATVKDFLDEVRSASGKEAVLASGGGVGWTFTSIAETWILIFGGKRMHDQLRKGVLSWQSPRVRDIFAQKLLPLIREGYFGEPDEYEALLKSMWNGKYPIFIGDSTDSQTIDPPEDRGVLLFPGQDTVMLWNDYWFTPQYTKHPKAAKKLIKFLATRGQEIQIAHGGRIGTYLNIPSSAYPESERDIFALLQTVQVVPDLDDSIGGKFQSTIWKQLALLWAKPDEKTLDHVLGRLQESSEETLKNK